MSRAMEAPRSRPRWALRPASPLTGSRAKTESVSPRARTRSAQPRRRRMRASSLQRYGTKAQRVRHDGHRRERHGRGGEHRREQPAREGKERSSRDGYERDVVDERPEEILADGREGAAGEPQRARDAPRVAPDQHDVSGRDGDVGP